jgi:hypothetical protein
MSVYLKTRASDILLQDCADPLQHAFLDLGRGLNTSHTALAQQLGDAMLVEGLTLSKSLTLS